MMRKLTLLTAGAIVAAGFVSIGPANAADSDVCAAMTTSIYQQNDPTKHRSLLTRWKSEADNASVKYGFTESKGAPFKAAVKPTPGLTPVHRLYKSSTSDFVWIAEGSELNNAVNNLGYVDEGINFYASKTALSCGNPVYRVVKGATHMYTTSQAERDQYLAQGWREGGATFHAVTLTTTPTPPTPPAPGDADGKFSIAIYPDTQGESHEATTGRIYKRSQWVVANKAAKDYRFVTHSGDLVNWGWLVPAQYTTASAGMKVLEDANMPYSIAIGNHDTRAVGHNGVTGSRGYGGSAYVNNPECVERLGTAQCKTNLLVRGTQEFNAVFTANRFGAVKGVFEANKVDNSYSTFTAAGKKFMVLNLELWPRPEAIEWAKGVVAAHPDHNVLVVTHSYLNGDGSISTSSGGYGATSPQYLYDNLVKVYPNVKMVFSGHTGGFASRTDTGVNGNKIASFLETMHSPAPQIPLRDLEVDVANGTIKTRMIDVANGNVYSGSEVTVTGMTWS